MLLTLTNRSMWLLPFVLAATACGSPEGSESNRAIVDAEANLAVPAGLQAELEQRAAAALSATVPDISTARFASIRAGAGRAMCGHISLRGTDGVHQPSRPFVVTPEGAALISAKPTIGWNDPNDPFPEPYGIWCASPEELQAIQSRRESFIPPPSTTPLDGNLLEEVPPAEEPVGAEEPSLPAPAPRPQREAPSRDPNDDSFFNAVLPPD